MKKKFPPIKVQKKEILDKILNDLTVNKEKQGEYNTKQESWIKLDIVGQIQPSVELEKNNLPSIEIKSALDPYLNRNEYDEKIQSDQVSIFKILRSNLINDFTDTSISNLNYSFKEKGSSLIELINNSSNSRNFILYSFIKGNLKRKLRE